MIQCIRFHKAVLMTAFFVAAVPLAADVVEQGVKDSAPSGLMAGVAKSNINPPVGIPHQNWGSATHVVATLLRFDEVLSAPASSIDVLGSPAHRELAREVAGRSVVLLRNEPVDGTPLLPLSSEVGSVAVLGRLSDVVNLGDGGSSDVWDLDCHTVLDGMRAAGVLG